MQKILFLVCFCGFCSLLAGQKNPKFTDGKSTTGGFVPVPGGTNGAKILATPTAVFQLCIDQSGLLGKTQDAIMYSYDPNSLNMVKTVSFPLEYEGNKCVYEDIILSGGNIYLFTSFYNSKQDAKYLFVQSIDKNSLLPNKDLRKVSEITETKSRYNSGEFFFITSQDKRKHLIYADMPRKRKDNEAFSLTVLDSNMQTLWTRGIELPYEEKLFLAEDYRVDDAGNAYLVGLLFNEKVRTKVKSKPNYSYKVFKYSGEKADPIEINITLTDKFINDLALYADGDTIICAGFYGNRNAIGTAGVFYASFDLNTKARIKETYKVFDVKELYSGLNERKTAKIQKNLDKGTNLMNDFEFRNMIIREDGGLILIGEKYYMYETASRSSVPVGLSIGLTNRQRHYVYGDIFVINISPNGTIEWSRRIPKMQRTVNDKGFFSSYGLAVNQNKVYFAFNDNLKNLTKPHPVGAHAMTFKKSKSIVSVVSVDNSGNIERKILYIPKETRTVLLAKYSSKQAYQDWFLVNFKYKNLFQKTQTNLQRITFH